MLTSEQHAIRMTGLGASEIGAVVGAAGSWESALTVWARKTGVLPPANDVVAEHIELGNLLEPVIAQLYARRTGYDLYEPGTLVHPTDPLRIATPDRLVKGQRRGAQIKKARTRGAWGEEGTDEIPENIQCQVQWEMSVADLEVEDVPVLFHGSKLAIFTVRRDDELIGILADEAHRFWRDHVLTKIPPPPDGSDRTRETLARMFPKNSGAMRYPTGDEFERVFGLVRDYDQARSDEKAAKDQKDTVGNALRLLIGDGTGFEGQWGSVSWLPDATGKPAWKQIAEEMRPPMTLVRKHTSEPGRTLRVHLKGAK